MQLNSIASPFGYAEAMAMRLNALVQRNAIKLREAHLRRFAYLDLPSLRLKSKLENPHTAKIREGRDPWIYVNAPHRYMSPIGWLKYTGEQLRAMRAAKGCGKRAAERPKRLQQQMLIMLPWNAKQVVVSFDVRTGNDSKPYFSDVKLLKHVGRNARNKRLERSLTEEQWHSLYQQMGRRLKAATVSSSYP